MAEQVCTSATADQHIFLTKGMSMRDNCNHNSMQSLLKSAMLVNNTDAPETLRKIYRQELEQDKKLFYEILQLDEDCKLKVNSDLRLHFKSVWEVLDEWLLSSREDSV